MGLPERKRTIVLYVPPGLSGVGGVQVQVVNLARELSSGNYPDVFTIVFASQGSFVDLSLSPAVSQSLELRTWESHNESLPENSLLLMWAGFRTVARFKKSNPRVLMWSVAPNQPFAHFERAAHRIPLLKSAFRSSCKRTVRYLASNESLVCMDLQNVEAMQTLAGDAVPTSYLPVGLPTGENLYAKRQLVGNRTERLHAAWVGRGTVNWKVTPLGCFLRDAVIPEQGVKVTVFTDSKMGYEQAFSELLSERQRARLEVHYEFGVVGADLTNRLASNCDLNLGMGLSVLEGAAVGVPSIYVAPQEDGAKTAYWQWVHDRAKSDFGPGPFWGERCDPFDFSALHGRQDGLIDLSIQSLAYAEYYHSIRSVAHKLLKLSPRATLVDYLDTHGKLFSILARFGGS